VNHKLWPLFIAGPHGRVGEHMQYTRLLLVKERQCLLLKTLLIRRVYGAESCSNRFVKDHIYYKFVDVFLNAFHYWHGWMTDGLISSKS